MTGPATPPMPARIKAERQRLGLTQSAVAERLGVARGTYAQAEHDTADPRYSTLVALVGLGMDPRALAPELFD